MVEAAGGRFHIHETGTGPVPVILEAGIAATSLSWALVQDEASKFAHVISYDRAGLGWSEPATGPRTPAVIVKELRAVLEAARIAGPYLLVGHSFGGLVVERFAVEYPTLAAGVVLVDALSPKEFFPLTEQKRAMLGRGISLSRRGGTLARMGIVRLCLGLVLGGNQTLPKLAARVSSGSGGEGLTARLAGEIRKLPKSVWPMVASHWSMPKSFESMARHLECLPDSCREMAETVLPEIPVTVISAAKNQDGPGVRVPASAQWITAEGSGHWVQLDQPELVVEAIRVMLKEITTTRA